MTGQASFDRAPVYAGLEAMAQLAALDVRQKLDFSAHAFLLGIRWCRLPAVRQLDGSFAIGVTPLSHSGQAFAYGTRARGPAGLTLEADLLIGTMAYDGHFQEQQLQSYYRKRWSCLLNATSSD